jgi:tetratricopeptide (TPR) repeat protein
MADAGSAPAAIGPFVVLQKLGEGAMGVVYTGYDVKLDRKVALKLIRRHLLGSPEARARMLREAQAMARLSHPNVVQVYQVGEHDELVYLAMEYVDGQTLEEWLAIAARPWQVVLATLVGAGRGLAAAHAAGLVHRDFKPDNVLVGLDGRARVLDFGLVYTAGDGGVAGLQGLLASGAGALPDLDEAEALRSGSTRLTQAGRLIGTPAYMSPEQHFGGPAGPAADQFSFAVTLYEALYGERPFRATTWAELRVQVQSGAITPPSRRSPVPGRLFKLLARALSPAPEQRWPTLGALLDALEHDPRRTGLRRAALALTAAAVAASSYAIAVTRLAEPPRCTGADAALADVWGPARREPIARALTATGAPYAAETWTRVSARLDAYSDAWIAEHRAACEAHADGTQSATLLDLRMACLERRRQHLAALVDVLAAPGRDAVAHAVQAVAGLPSLAGCRDADALLAAVPPPDDPVAAARVRQLRDELARGEALERTGDAAAGVKRAEDVRAAARQVGYAPLVAEASLAEGRMLSTVGRALDAEAVLTSVIREATEPGLEAIAAEAAAIWIFVVGENPARAEAALTAEPFVEALIGRAHDDGRIAALMHNNLGTVYDIKDDDATAAAHYRRTIELLQARPGLPDMSLVAAHHNLGELLSDEGNVDAAASHFNQVIAVLTEIHGERNPMIAHPLCGTAELDRRRGAHTRALERFRRALVLFELYGDDSLYVIQALVGLGRTQLAVGDVAAGAISLRRAAGVAERLGHPHQLQGLALAALAELTEVQGQQPAARSLFERAVAAYDAALGPGAPPSLPATLRAAELAETLGDAAAAERWYERALAIRTHHVEYVAARGLAALGLARRLGDRDRDRVCTLATEAATGIVETDPRHAEAVALRDRGCREQP